MTTVSAGTLQAGSTTALSATSDFTVNSTLDLGGFSNAIGSLAGTGTVTNSGAAATLNCRRRQRSAQSLAECCRMVPDLWR